MAADKVAASARPDKQFTFNHSAVMTRAWVVFRFTYSCSAIPFTCIGRHCFGAPLRRAWAEAHREAELAATPLDTIIHRVAALKRELGFLAYRPFSVDASRQRERLERAIAELRAELDRRAAICWAALAADAGRGGSRAPF